jgi:putative endonuclease
MEKRQVGAVGEKMAESYLRGKGYRILERNYSCRYGEADIIAQDRDYLVFVEVKLRKNAGFAEAREYVDRHKQKRLISTAKYYLMVHDCDLPVRFDVIEVYSCPGTDKKPRMEHIENAFE